MSSGADWGLRFVLALAIGTMTISSVSADLAAIHPAQGELLPDLVPASMSVSPSLAQEGDVLQISVTVENRGLGPAASATVGLIDLRPNGDVVPIGRTPLSSPLAPGASAYVAMPAFVAAVAGQHTLMIRVEDVMPDEANRDNDVLSIPIQIQSSAAPPPPLPSAGGLRVAIFEDLRFLTLLGVIVIVLVAALATLPFRRREDVELMPPPPDPPDEIPPPLWPP